jgi:hypothetical protein
VLLIAFHQVKCLAVTGLGDFDVVWVHSVSGNLEDPEKRIVLEVSLDRISKAGLHNHCMYSG